ncbi:hypothetical protein BRADI_5g18235v3 [Brachypodium distachyon]|uniref:Uncharacterized protein n=1 Tax=Brachypodium distachyon TaxID=15368 RepID=A0A2K2CHZ4_BRADI|nr:hypothetical protein BRADI_5g18235v3 [Brachypodium distachyon]
MRVRGWTPYLEQPSGERGESCSLEQPRDQRRLGLGMAAETQSATSLGGGGGGGGGAPEVAAVRRAAAGDPGPPVCDIVWFVPRSCCLAVPEASRRRNLLEYVRRRRSSGPVAGSGGLRAPFATAVGEAPSGRRHLPGAGRSGRRSPSPAGRALPPLTTSSNRSAPARRCPIARAPLLSCSRFIVRKLPRDPFVRIISLCVTGDRVCANLRQRGFMLSEYLSEILFGVLRLHNSSFSSLLLLLTVSFP